MSGITTEQREAMREADRREREFMKALPNPAIDEIEWDGIRPEDLTPSQRDAIVRIWKAGHERASNGGRSETDTKKFEISELASGRYTKISVILEIGLEGESGLQFLTRSSGHFFVGSHGGIEIAGIDYDSDYDGKRSAAREHPLIYGW